jgi:hypothetical protein|tara:strand:- start:627 stop:1076 length:450 start_codon:yes stop_codon:yes gene_type:complete
MLFEAIAAVKIANEAIGAIKEFAGHIQSVGELGPQLTKLADATEEIEKKAKEGDMNAFFALEKIRAQESEIKQLFIYSGRAGLWDDYQKFIANRKQLRENEKKREQARKLAKKKAVKNALLYGAAGILILGAVGLAVAFVFWLISLKGS